MSQLSSPLRISTPSHTWRSKGLGCWPTNETWYLGVSPAWYSLACLTKALLASLSSICLRCCLPMTNTDDCSHRSTWTWFLVFSRQRPLPPRHRALSWDLGSCRLCIHLGKAHSLGRGSLCCHYYEGNNLNPGTLLCLLGPEVRGWFSSLLFPQFLISGRYLSPVDQLTAATFSWVHFLV